MINKTLVFLVVSALFQWFFADKVSAQSQSDIRANQNAIFFTAKAPSPQDMKSVVFVKTNSNPNRIAGLDEAFASSSGTAPLLDEIIADVNNNVNAALLEKTIKNELAQIDKTIDAKQEIAMAIEANKWAQACGQFTTKESLGGWGQAIMNLISLERTPYLMLGASDFDKYCPLYPKLSERNKQHVWVLVLTAMAFFESSCDSARAGVGPNGDLMGLLQLHLNKENQYSKGCRKGDSKTAKGNISCGLSMLNDQLGRGEPLFSTKSYWDVLRPQAKTKRALQIMTVLKHNGLCKD